MSEYVIAKYIRLSIDDGVTESMSIPHQQLLLDKHIDELDIPNATTLEFVDNGHSGTNLDRPAVQEMLELVRCGRIHCIVTKDFSRFSRNAMESGYYIEQVFPLYHVRFIAIGESFDSNDFSDGTGGIDVAFRFLMHEYYSKDLSQKVKSVKRLQMQKGENIVANAIYGYRKNNIGKWEPDPAPAEIVKMIFQMTLNGLPTSQIRDKLFEAKYPTPKEYIETNRGKDVDVGCLWTARMVRHILTNEQYTGTYIAGKQESKAVGSHSKFLTDKSDWIVIPDSHPPIVSKEDFLKVQELREYRKGATTVKPIQVDMNRPKRTRMANGEFIAATAIYGYSKTKNGKLEIDEIAGKVVQEIYEMAANELSYAEICSNLSASGYPIPFDYIKLKKGKTITPSTAWTVKSIRSILKNEQYIGSYVSGKILKDYDSGKKYYVPKDEWIVIPNSHSAIISNELFDQVQQITATSRTKRKNTVNPRNYLLYKKVVCGCCGYALMYDSSTVNTTYRCHHTYADPNAECHKMKVSVTELDDTILSIIKKQAQVVLKSWDITKVKKVSLSQKPIQLCQEEIEDCKKRQQTFYEEFVSGIIDRDTFKSLKDEWTLQLDKLENRLAILKQGERDKLTDSKVAKVAREVLTETATPQDIVNAMVEKVFVFPGNKIKIKWKFVNFAMDM